MSLWRALRSDVSSNIPVWVFWVFSAILGAVAAFLAALADGVLFRFGDDLGLRAVVVFLIAWPIASVVIYWATRRPDLIGKPVQDGLPPPPTRSHLVILFGGLAVILLMWLLLKVAIFIFG